MYVPGPRRFPVCRDDRTEAQQFHGPTDDLNADASTKCGNWEVLLPVDFQTDLRGFNSLWDTNAGLVATDLERLVSEVLHPFPKNAGFADGLFVMTTATDHKNNLNRSVLKKDHVRTLRVETIANSAGGTAQVSIVAQPSKGFLNTKYYSNGSPTEDTEDCLGRSENLTSVVR